MLRWLVLFGMLVGLSACGDTANPADLPTRVTLPALPPTPTVAALSEVNLIGVLNFWEIAHGVLVAGAADGWYFVGTANDPIMVRVLGVEVTLTLLSEDGQVIYRGADILATLPADGVYVVVVQAMATPDDGLYEIGLSYSDRPNPSEVVPTPLPEVVGVPTPAPAYAELGMYIGRLTSGNAIGGMLNVGDPDHIYLFDGTAGEYVQLAMERVSGGIDPRITLYGPDGLPIAMDDDSSDNGDARLRNIRLPMDGAYTVQAGGGGTAGGYSLLFQRSGLLIQPTATPIPILSPTPTVIYAVPTPSPVAIPGDRLSVNLPVLSWLNDTYTTAVHLILTAAEEVITVGACPAADSSLRLQLELRDPQGQSVAQDSVATTGVDDCAVIPSFLATGGTYSIMVSAEDAATGSYIIAYGRGATWLDEVHGEAIRDEINEGEITRRGVREVWTLRLQAGDIIAAAVNPVASMNFDPVLELVPVLTPEVIIALDDNSGGGASPFIQRAVIPESGLYALRVYDARGATTGAYTLIWRYINIASTPTPIYPVAPILVVDDHVPDLAYQFYAFQGLRGQSVRIRVISTEAGFDPVAALVGPDGAVITTVDDTDGDLNPVFVVVLPSDGTYKVRVNGYLQGGAFQVWVEEVLD